MARTRVCTGPTQIRLSQHPSHASHALFNPIVGPLLLRAGPPTRSAAPGYMLALSAIGACRSASTPAVGSTPRPRLPTAADSVPGPANVQYIPVSNRVQTPRYYTHTCTLLDTTRRHGHPIMTPLQRPNHAFRGPTGTRSEGGKAGVSPLIRHTLAQLSESCHARRSYCTV